MRAMLLAVTGCAVLLGAWRTWGDRVFFWALFVIASLAAGVLLKGSWKRAHLWAYSAAYGPFVAMATYTWFFVDCSHCKATAWATLPYGPGAIPTLLGSRLLELLPPRHVIELGIALLISAAAVAGLTWLVKSLGFWGRTICLATAAALCSFLCLRTAGTHPGVRPIGNNRRLVGETIGVERLAGPAGKIRERFGGLASLSPGPL